MSEQSFTKEELNDAMTCLSNYDRDKVMDNLTVPKYVPTNGVVYAYKLFKGDETWQYVIGIPHLRENGIVRRPLTGTERGIKKFIHRRRTDGAVNHEDQGLRYRQDCINQGWNRALDFVNKSLGFK